MTSIFFINEVSSVRRSASLEGHFVGHKCASIARCFFVLEKTSNCLPRTRRRVMFRRIISLLLLQEGGCGHCFERLFVINSNIKSQNNTHTKRQSVFSKTSLANTPPISIPNPSNADRSSSTGAHQTLSLSFVFGFSSSAPSTSPTKSPSSSLPRSSSFSRRHHRH